MNNPLEIFKMIKNPEQYVRNLAKEQNNPMLNNLIKMAEQNNKGGVENFAKNLFQQKGIDFDKDIMSFLK